MKSRAFAQVDVFSATPLLGNPVAVVLDGVGLDDATMQRFACWTNLSETTFVLPPTDAGRAAGAHYRLRIFTPGGELPFAGHPTLGSCYAWGQALNWQGAAASTELRQECAQGIVALRRHSDGSLAFAAPPSQRRAVDPSLLQAVVQALGLKPKVRAASWLDNGPQWLCLLIDDLAALHALTPDHAALKTLGTKVAVAHQQTATTAAANANTPDGTAPLLVTVRAFAAAIGINEDPVTGSLNASLAQWLMDEHAAPAAYTAAQGESLGRAGRVQVQRDAQGQVWVGGPCVTCVRGEVML